MGTDRRIIAAMEVVLVLPAALFLTSVVTRHLQSMQSELAAAAQQIVTWYVVRHWTLWVLLIGLPFAALLTGCVTLLGNSNEVPHQAARQPFAAIRTDRVTRIIAAATLSAGAILVVVVLHVLAN